MQLLSKKRTQSHFQPVRRWALSLNGIMFVLPTATFDAIILGGLIVWNAFLFYSMATQNINDFGRFYYSAAAFLEGKDMYGPNLATASPHSKLENQHFWNMNPPHFHLLLVPLTFFSPQSALIIWSLVSLICLVVSLRLIVKEIQLKLTPWQCRLALASLLAFSGTAGVIVTGQLSFLLLLPITLAWIAARRGSWTIAGIHLGLAMSVKPFLLIFLPYLVLGRQFRAAITTCGVALLCFLIGLFIFGIDAHASWYGAISSVNWMWASGNGSVLGFLTRALSENPSYAPLLVAPTLIKPLWIGAIMLVALLTYLASVTDPTTEAVDRSFALLLLASQLISPLGWIYYFCLPLGPSVVLASSWLSQREPASRSTLLFWAHLRNLFLLIAIPGLVWPLFVTDLFQPYPWATISIGSVYFWTTFMLWLSLLADRCAANATSRPELAVNCATTGQA